MTHLAVYVKQTPHDEEYLRELVERSAGSRVRLTVVHREEELEAVLPDVDVLLTEVLAGGWVARAPKLRWVHLNVSGVEKSMVPAVLDHPLVITNSRGMHAQHVAEHALMTILAFAKEFPRALRAQAEKRWVYGEIVTRNYTLAGRTCGVLGLGAIGLEMARLAHACRMHVLATRRHAAGPPPDGVDAVYPTSRLSEVLARSDFVVVCLPLTAETRGMVDRQALCSMKKGAYLINISRGRVVDEEALLDVLRDEHLGGAALDVFGTEPLPPDSPFWTAPNVLVTPHVSGNYEAYNRDVADVFVENLLRYLSGSALSNLVNKSLGY